MKSVLPAELAKGANKRQGYMKLFPASEPFEVVHLDIVGPLPVTRFSYKYCLTMMDRFSRLVKIVPLSSVNATDIANAFRIHWLKNYGFPQCVLCDRGVQFTSFVMKLLTRMYGIKQKFTSRIIRKRMDVLNVSIVI